MAVDEKRFYALGKEWVARFDFNSICELEERYDRPFLDLVAPFLGSVQVSEVEDEAKLVQAASLIKFADLRAILHQSLLTHQPETTLAETGEIVGEVGLTAMMGVVAWAIAKAMPKGDEGNAPAPKRRKG
jgi:hypothetical protein